MHELSLAQALVRRIDEEAVKAGLSKVLRAELRVGPLLGADTGLLAEAFRCASEGARCAGADLEFSPGPASAVCLVCGGVYVPRWGDTRCPHCGQTEPRILEGADLILAAVTGERDD